MHYVKCSSCHGRWERLALTMHNGLGTLPERANRAQVARPETTRVFPPRCTTRADQTLALRSNRTDRQIFWGCPVYPRCCETRLCTVKGASLTLEFTAAEDGRSTPIATGTIGRQQRAMDPEPVDLTMNDSESDSDLEAP